MNALTAKSYSLIETFMGGEASTLASLIAKVTVLKKYADVTEIIISDVITL